MTVGRDDSIDYTAVSDVPRHIAVIMDGNGRWAVKHGKPRFMGHRAGLETVRNLIRHAAESGVQALTLFAFSSENWQRPREEVTMLMDLFASSLEKETDELHESGIRLGFIGNRDAFSARLIKKIIAAEKLTSDNEGMQVNFAVSYGGRWDIARATRKICEQVLSGEIALDDVDETMLGKHVCLADLPQPDLFIRTGGEKRISNFLLWQLAYTELYFTDVLWPDFEMNELDMAIQWYMQRQRRFGMTGEQIESVHNA